jgi:hypothetical protein
MNTYTYKPTNLVSDENGIVRAVDFTVLVSDGTDSFEINGHTGLPMPGADAKPYDQLTQEEVIGWIKNLVGEQTEEQADAELEAYKVRSVIKNGIPWDNK